MNLAPEIAAAVISSGCTCVLFWLGRKRRQHKQPERMPRIESETVPTGELLKLIQRQHGLCAISGLPLTPAQASLDRVYGSRGDTRNGSVRIVIREIKRLKGDLPDARFLEICRAVAKHQEQEQ